MAQSTETSTKKKRELNVSLGQLGFGGPDRDLAIYGLGSCIGLVLWSPSKQVGVLCHIVQPSSKGAPLNPASPAKFADWAIPRAIKGLKARGASQDELIAKMAGGAHPLAAALGASAGTQNAKIISEVLEEKGIPVVAKSIGGSIGRTIVFRNDTGTLEVKMADGTIEEL